MRQATKQTPEVIAKVLSMRANGGTQMSIADELGMNVKTIQRIDKLTSIPAVKASEPESLRKEWFGILAHRIRQAVGDGDDIKTAALITAGAALLNTPDPTGIMQAAGVETTSTAATDKPTLKDVKAMKPMVIHVPVGNQEEKEVT